jgi:hypothetical protein
LFDDGRPKEYLPEQIAKAFPPVEVQAPSPHCARAVGYVISVDYADGPITQLQIGTSIVGRRCLYIHAGDHCTTIVRLTATGSKAGCRDLTAPRR